MLRTTPGYGPLALNSFDVGAYRKAFGEACLIDVGQSIQSTFDIHSMLILMKHQKKLHLCPFGQTHRPKRQRKQRFQLPTELAAVLQPHSKVSRVGGRAFGEACLIDVGQSIQSTFDIHSMLILMKHQKKLHLCPFGQTHRPKRQRKQRFQLPTELAAVLQPHSKVSRVGGRNGLCGSTGLVSFLGHLHVTICYIYLRTSCMSCLLTMEAANEASDKSPDTKSGDPPHCSWCQEATGALHKLLACGLMDTDAQAGVTNPGKRFAMSKTHGTIVLKYSFGDRDGFVRACQSYVSAVKARVAVFDHPAQRGCGM